MSMFAEARQAVLDQRSARQLRALTRSLRRSARLARGLEVLLGQGANPGGRLEPFERAGLAEEAPHLAWQLSRMEGSLWGLLPAEE